MVCDGLLLVGYEQIQPTGNITLSMSGDGVVDNIAMTQAIVNAVGFESNRHNACNGEP